MIQASLHSARSLSAEVVAVSVQFDKTRAAPLERRWARWDPGVEPTVLQATTHSITAPMLHFLGSPEIRARGQIRVLIPEVEPR